MRLAWFRPATHVSGRLDDTAALVAALATEHEIELFDRARAHEFIRLDFRAPFDLTVFELADSDDHAFVWPYLMHRPGVLRLRSRSLYESRARSLVQQRRNNDRANELAFSGSDMVAAPIRRSRVTVVPDSDLAARLQREYPEARIRYAPVGLAGPGSDPLQRPTSNAPTSKPAVTLIGSLDQSQASTVRRAVVRAQQAGARLELMTGAAVERVLDEADVIVALQWPPATELTGAIAGMAAAKPVIVYETESSAGWPAFDPQTWQPRGWTGQPPIVVSIDPRDDEHSLALALRRLATDATLRRDLGVAAHEWWRAHATIEHVVRAWRSILTDAASMQVPPRPANWPAHLTADGSERAREILGEFATTVDFL